MEYFTTLPVGLFCVEYIVNDIVIESVIPKTLRA